MANPRQAEKQGANRINGWWVIGWSHFEVSNCCLALPSVNGEVVRLGQRLKLCHGRDSGGKTPTKDTNHLTHIMHWKNPRFSLKF